MGKIQVAFCGLCLLFSVFFLPSCLNDVNTAFNPGTTPAVVRTERADDRVVADTRFGTIYSEKLNSNADGQCLLVEFSYNAANPENGNYYETGYYAVWLLKQTPVARLNALAETVDRKKLLSHEQVIKAAVDPERAAWCETLDNCLFVPSLYKSTAQQTVSWKLAYDPEQGMQQSGERTVYPLYLRAWASAGAGEEAKDTTLAAIHAFDIGPFLEDIRKENHWDGRGELFVVLNYIDYIDPADSTRFEWMATEPVRVQ